MKSLLSRLPEDELRPNQWFKSCYSRILIDNHITEDDPAFMAKFDLATYVEMVKKAGVDSAMVYACCHNGNCYYPTKVGHMHKNLAGRDIFGEMVSLLRQEGIVPVAYYTVVYHNSSAKNNPDWRCLSHSGSQHDGRYWYSCPNNQEYREFAKRQIREIVNYDVAGIFIDMTFWPGVCVCHSCQERYRRESGLELPSVIDWSNERWVAFQRARERWVAEFAVELTECVKQAKPDVTVNHQFAGVLAGWLRGQSPAIADACDYLGGDFYGDKYQQSLGAKVLTAFTRNIPFEFMTSRCVDLYDHTSMKSEDEMFCEIALTLANGGAYFFIDAINPDGTLSEDVYDRLGNVSQRARPFAEKIRELRPTLTADIGLYFSMPSFVDQLDNGIDLRRSLVDTRIMTAWSDIAPIRELTGTSTILDKAHIPYRVVTSEKVDTEGLGAIIVNNAAYMSASEVEKLRGFVREGGTLIATGRTSLHNLSGETSGDFQLADVFGVSYSGSNSDLISYLVFKGEIDSLPSEVLAEGGRTQYVVSNSAAPLVTATTAAVMAEVYGTRFTANDPENYASIHSNPPGGPTGFHGLTINRFGKGRCVYLYSSILASRNDAQQTFGRLLFERYAPSGVILSCDAPPCVQVTLLKSADGCSYLLCFVDYQNELPNVPVIDVSVILRIPEEARPTSCVRVSDGVEMDWIMDGDEVRLVLPHLETLEIVEISVE